MGLTLFHWFAGQTRINETHPVEIFTLSVMACRRTEPSISAVNGNAPIKRSCSVRKNRVNNGTEGCIFFGMRRMEQEKMS